MVIGFYWSGCWFWIWSSRFHSGKVEGSPGPSGHIQGRSTQLKYSSKPICKIMAYKRCKLYRFSSWYHWVVCCNIWNVGLLQRCVSLGSHNRSEMWRWAWCCGHQCEKLTLKGYKLRLCIYPFYRFFSLALEHSRHAVLFSPPKSQCMSHGLSCWKRLWWILRYTPVWVQTTCKPHTAQTLQQIWRTLKSKNPAEEQIFTIGLVDLQTPDVSLRGD